MDNPHDGIVIVSMSNLFHIFDKERAAETKILKITKRTSGKLKRANKTLNNIITDPSHVETVFTEASEKSPKKDEKYNIKKKRTCCDYFFNLVLICFLMIFLNGCYIWIVFIIFSRPKNKFYCFDSDSREFKICGLYDFCPINGVRDIIYSDSIYDININNEIKNINDKYIDFYVKQATVYSFMNKKISRKNPTMHKFGVTIISTYKENYLLKNTFKTGCENYMLNVVLAIGFGTIIGNIIFGYVGDIFGRKKVIIIAHFIEIIGSLIIIFTTYSAVNRGKKITDEEFKPFNNKKIFNFDYTKDDYYHIQNFIRYFNLKYFENSNMNKIYKENFNTFIQEILESKYINDYFMKYRFLFVFGFFLIFSSNSTIKSSILAFILENALTEYSMNLYFLYFNFTFPLSLFFTIIMITSLDSFHFFMLIVCILQFLLIIIYTIFFYESQRFNFEYAYYTRITDFAVYILGEDKLKKKYSEDFKYNEKSNIDKEKVQINLYYSKDTRDKYKIKNELNNNQENESATFLSSFLESEEDSKISKKKKENIIKRNYILGNPFSILSLINKEKLIKSHMFLVLSFISSLSLVSNISLSKITSPAFITREKLITSETIIFSNITLYPILYFIILFPFIHAFIKCIGLGIILRISLGMTFFSSIIYELICLSSREMTDLTETKYNSMDIIYYKYIKALTAFIYLDSISNVGIQYSLYFFLTKLTKTIYRCSFFGICNIFIDLTFLISLALEEAIEKTYAYSFLFALISFIISIFIIPNDDSLNITDLREIKFNDKIKYFF
jgi:hypothetical protein